MRLFPSPQAPDGDPSQGPLTTKELIVVVVVIVVAGVLAAFGLPLFGAIEFIVGALYVATCAVRAMRTAPPLTGTA